MSAIKCDPFAHPARSLAAFCIFAHAYIIQYFVPVVQQKVH